MLVVGNVQRTPANRDGRLLADDNGAEHVACWDAQRSAWRQQTAKTTRALLNLLLRQLVQTVDFVNQIKAYNLDIIIFTYEQVMKRCNNQMSLNMNRCNSKPKRR